MGDGNESGGTAAGRPGEHTMPEDGSLRLEVPNRPAYLPVIRHAVADAARLAGFGQEAAAYPARVAGRLAARLMDPGVAPPEGGTLVVVVRPVGPAVSVSLGDDGPPFDPQNGGRAEEVAHSLLEADSPDWIAFSNAGRSGRRLTALLHPPGTAADAAPAGEPPAPLEDERSLVVFAAEPAGAWVGGVGPAPAPGPQRSAGPPAGHDLRIGLMGPGEAAAVSRCIFDAYRLTYFDEMMYEPERLVELNRAGDMVSAVAVAPDGVVAGHVALEFTPGERATADVAAAVTHRDWRGHGIAERLFAFLVDEAGRRGMAGLWCDAVTVHPFTQRLAHSLGFVPCGFHLGFEPPSTRFFGINDRPAHRGSSVVMFRTVGGLSDAPLGVPGRHRDFVAGVYERLGAPGRLDGGAPAGSPPGDTRMRTYWHPVLEVARLTIDAPGADVDARLRAELRDALLREAKVVEARLNLQAAGAARACDAFEAAGFIVTGVVPGGPDADWLLLQYHRGIAIDYDGMVVDAEESRRLLAVVRAGDPSGGAAADATGA